MLVAAFTVSLILGMIFHLEMEPEIVELNWKPAKVVNDKVYDVEVDRVVDNAKTLGNW